MIRYKFENTLDKAFAKALRTRVNEYFHDNEVRKDANRTMIVKTIIILSMYLVPFFLLILGGFSNLYLLAGLWMVMGIGKAFVGTTIMHDSIHGSYFRNKSLNKLITFSATIVGVDKLIWHIQHNVLHHTYTNIEETDEDILPRIVFRYSTNQPHKWIHKFQHIYAPLFYCVPLLEWITTKDFVKAFDYVKFGIIKKEDFPLEFTKIVLRKIFYWVIFLVLPVVLIPASAGITILMIFVSHCISGIMLAMIFQTAHVVEHSKFYKFESEKVKQSWVAHQLKTTCNYGMDNKVLSWFLGGLNFQIEHHLFPDICHVHYPAISKLVQQIVKEFDLPYHAYPSFGAAVSSHFAHLKKMGSAEDLKVAHA